MSDYSVIERLEKLEDRFDERFKSLEEKVDQIRAVDIPSINVSIAKLQVQAGLWGSVGGGLAGVLALLLPYLLKAFLGHP